MAWRKPIFNDNLPHITSQPQDQSATVSQSVTFEVTATGPAPLAYQWQKDDVAIPSATGFSYRIASFGPNDGGAYRVIVSNAAGSETIREAILSLSTNLPSVANIFAPWEGYRWRPGETVAFSGTGPTPGFSATLERDGLGKPWGMAEA